MRLAQLMAGAPDGGAEVFFERLSAALSAAGDDVLPLIRADAGRIARLRATGLAPQGFRYGGSLDVLTKWRLRRALTRFAPRAAIAWMGRAARHAPTGPWVLVGRLGGYYDLRQFARCDHLAANTPALRDWIVKQGRFPETRVHVLPNFVPDMAGAAPAALPMVPPGATLVLALGRLHRNKGFDVLLAAMTRLPGVHAAIAGDGPEAGGLRRLAQQAGIADRVHFLGWRQDTASLLARADLLACPSRQEALGNVVLEAFSARRPVVAAMADGPRQLIDPGRTGVLVPVESAIALAAGIEGILQNESQTRAIVEAARTAYDTHHAEPVVTKTWQSFLSGIEKPQPEKTRP